MTASLPLVPDWDLLQGLLGDHLHPGGTALSMRMLDLADPPPDGLLVDVGSGRGATLRLARLRWPRARLIGIDPAVTSGASAPAMDGITTLRGHATAIPQASASADLVLSECALCLAGSWEPALEEVRRVLRSGGRLVFSDFYAEGPIPPVPAAVGPFACLANARSGQEMRRLLEKAGFRSPALLDESPALWELERRVQARVDVRGLLERLTHASRDGVWADLHRFLEQTIRARDTGALRYGVFVGTK